MLPRPLRDGLPNYRGKEPIRLFIYVPMALFHLSEPEMKYNHKQCSRVFGAKQVSFEKRKIHYVKGFRSVVGRNDIELGGQALTEGFPLYRLCPGQGPALNSWYRQQRLG